MPKTYQYPNPNTPHKHCWHPLKWDPEDGENEPDFKPVTGSKCCLCGATKQQEPKAPPGYDALLQKVVKENY